MWFQNKCILWYYFSMFLVEIWCTKLSDETETIFASCCEILHPKQKNGIDISQQRTSRNKTFSSAMEFLNYGPVTAYAVVPPTSELPRRLYIVKRVFSNSTTVTTGTKFLSLIWKKSCLFLTFFLQTYNLFWSDLLYNEFFTFFCNSRCICQASLNEVRHRFAQQSFIEKKSFIEPAPGPGCPNLSAQLRPKIGYMHKEMSDSVRTVANTDKTSCPLQEWL